MFDDWNIKSAISVSTESSDEPLEKGDYEKKQPPKDKYWIVYIIILINGIGVLLPWNMFITISPDYYVNYWFTINNKETSYGKSFMSALGISAQIPNFIISIINVTQIIGGSMMIRIAGPLAINCINVVVILALVIFQQPSADAMHWFYIVSLTIVMIMNASNGLYQNSIFGLAADFPAKYTNALVVGNNICGTFTSVISIITIIAFNNSQTVALLYFSISLAVLVICGISLWCVGKLEFYKFHTQKGNIARQLSNSSRPSLEQFWETFKNCWPQLVSIFLVYFVTLSVFPTILVGIRPYSEDGKTWTSVFPKNTYAEITTFLNFNLFAAIGSTTASFIQFVNNSDIFNNILILIVPSSMSKTAGMAAALALVAGE
uniref:Equilibrative nucleoside transporter 3 n=1 Tax=Heterorhabditis bacteriophora TaxID=37862 RepID=A0A1I7XJI3_HETBA